MVNNQPALLFNTISDVLMYHCLQFLYKSNRKLLPLKKWVAKKSRLNDKSKIYFHTVHSITVQLSPTQAGTCAKAGATGSDDGLEWPFRPWWRRSAPWKWSVFWCHSPPALRGPFTLTCTYLTLEFQMFVMFCTSGSKNGDWTFETNLQKVGQDSEIFPAEK